MQFGLFGSASARRGSGEFDSTEGYHDWIEYNVEAEALGFRSTFCVEHHFTGYGQVSATLNLLTWLGARTKTLRLGTAVMVLPWHNPVLLAEQAATLDLLSGGRLDFGIGTGYRYNEFVGFDLPMDDGTGEIRGIDRRHPQGLDIERTLLAQGKILDLQQHRRRAAVVPQTAPGSLDGRRQRTLDSRCRPPRLQSAAGPVLLAGRRCQEHRDLPRRRGSEGREMGPDARRRDPRLLRYRRCARTRGSAGTTAGQPACGN